MSAMSEALQELRLRHTLETDAGALAGADETLAIAAEEGAPTPAASSPPRQTPDENEECR
jgi:hypothetical protein